MKKLISSILSIALTLSLVFGCLPADSLADEPISSSETVVEEIQSEDCVSNRPLETIAPDPEDDENW